jgi:hypothetical protein
MEWSELVGERMRYSEDCCSSVLVKELVAKGRGHFGNPEEGKRPPLEAVTTRLVKTQQTEMN